MERKTEFSPDRVYRFTLWREWDCDLLTGCADDLPNPNRYVQFIGLNPSTADETKDDPTIRRCIGFAKAWGYGALCMTNLFAFRATDPNVMKASQNPTGGKPNNNFLLQVASEAGLIIAAWGTHGDFNQRAEGVKCLLHEAGVGLSHLGLTAGGHPKHPLYLKKNLIPEGWL